MTFSTWLRRARAPSNCLRPLHTSRKGPTNCFWISHCQIKSPDKPRSCCRLVWIHRTLADKWRYFVGRQKIGYYAAALINLCTFLCRSLQNSDVKWPIFRTFFKNWKLSVHVWPEQGFRPIGVLNRFTQLQYSKIKYKYIFYEASSSASLSSLLKLPE